jgi:phosphatidylglycerophosphatase A
LTISEIDMTSISSRHRTTWPTLRWVFSDPARILMFGFGSGLIRPGSGTWGSLLAWFLWIVVSPGANHLAIGIFLLLCFVYGCWAAHRVSQSMGVQDHVGIVWDEFVALWLVLWLVPDSLFAQGIAFVLFRFFDTVKPPPIRQVDARFKGGVGVMVDDLLAAFYTLIVMALLMRFGPATYFS